MARSIPAVDATTGRNGLLRATGLLALLLGAGAPPLPAAPAPALRTEAPRVVPSLPRQRWEPRLNDDTVAWEAWDYVFAFPGGHRLLAQFQVASEPLHRRHGLVTGIVVLPDRTTRVLRNSRPRGEWRSELAGDEVRLTLHTHRFVVGGTRHRVHLQNHVGRFEIEAETTTERVDLGRVSGPDGAFYELALLAPRLRCSGVLQLAGGPAVELRDGWGIATHACSSRPAHRLARSSAALHAFDGAVQWSLFAQAVPHDGGQESFGWLLLSRDGRTIEVTRSVDRLWSGPVREAEPPRYLTPRALQVRSSEGMATEAQVALRPVARFDVLGWIENPFVRFLAGRASHPVQYLFDARYELRLGRETTAVSGDGLLTLSILDQPLAEWP